MWKTALLLITLILLLPVAVTMPPPWTYYPEACENSGGNWPGHLEMNSSEWNAGNYSTQSCECPENTSLLWGKCWKRTPKQACENLDGKITSSGKLGSPGAGFKCVEETENGTVDITDKADNYSAMANQELKEMKNETDGETDGEDENSGGFSLATYVLLGILAALAGAVTGRYLRKRKGN